MAEQVYHKLHTNRRQADNQHIDQAAVSIRDEKPLLGYRMLFIVGLFFGVVATIVSQYLIRFPSTANTEVWAESITHGLDAKLDQERFECGIDSHEAEAAGCHFDIMASS